MNQLRPLWLLIIAASAALAGYLATIGMVSAGQSSPVLPLSSAVTLAAVGLIVLVLGIVVGWDQRRLQSAARESQRQKRSGESPSYSRPRRRLHPLQAARVVAAGQACAYAGALIAGWHGGVLLDLGSAAGLRAPNASSALVMMIGGLIWVIIGFVVESLCRIPPEDGGSLGQRDDTTRGFDEEPGTGYARQALPRHIHR
ncbi:DUF3180 domain-containing protein [Nesterenkonia flava]|uniref:DUF3180 domain-containing protein n=1 Tax=Nesterenkonia flava TaxID=469799 RepID=A0ABU1FUA1_9MICC|nr:DUF3180 domain-containing protein [Nesterenkonia flava]MDR5712193.1 DUF3180 domain-containing protein [Nesterenkonia flava]